MSNKNKTLGDETPENQQTVVPMVDVEARKGIDEIKTGLQGLIDLIKDERKEREAMAKELRFVADKSRQAMWDEKTSAGKDSPRVYKIPSFNGKLVVGWSKMNQNLVQNTDKVWIEKLETTLYYEDGTEEKVDYKEWQVARLMVEGVYESEELTKDTRIIRLVTKDGKKLSIDVRFLN